MKIVVYIAVIGIAGALGYLLEPTLRPMITNVSSAPVQMPPTAEASDKVNEVANDTEISIAAVENITPKPTPTPAPTETPSPVTENSSPTTESIPAAAETNEATTNDTTNTSESPATPSVTPEAIPAPSGSSNPVDAMRASIQSGQFKELKIDKILSWNPGGEETIDGVTFATGTVSYEAETIFGLKTVQAKALIQNGVVKKWISPNSGAAIK
jgi:hypothetical protein